MTTGDLAARQPRISTAMDRLWRATPVPVARTLPAATPEIGLFADLSVGTVVELLRMLRAGKRSGAFLAMTDDGERALFLEGGVLAGALSTHTPDRLGEVLWRRGRISLDQLLIATASLRPGYRLGRCLVELGFIAPSDLYESLRFQALSILDECCLIERGSAAFVTGVALHNPLRLDDAMEDALTRAVEAREECRELEFGLLQTTRTLTVRRGVGTGKMSEAETAMVQLAASAKGGLLSTELLRRASLGRLDGLRALQRLLDDGVLVDAAGVPATPVAAKPDPRSAIGPLCQKLNVALEVLEKDGFGAGDTVLDYVRNPPEQFAEEMAVLPLKGRRVDEVALATAADMLDDGHVRLAAALQALLDFALFEARDTLSEAAFEKLRARL